MDGKLPHTDMCSSTPKKTNHYCCLSEPSSQSQFMLLLISHFPVPSQMPLSFSIWLLFFLMPLIVSEGNERGNRQFRHQSVCHLFRSKKLPCNNKRKFSAVKKKSQPENPPLEILGRVGDEQYIAVLIFCLQACQSQTQKSGCSLSLLDLYNQPVITKEVEKLRINRNLLQPLER